MAVRAANPAIEDQARALAADNRRAEPNITRVLWFPDDREVRLVEVTDDVPTSEEGEVRPFYFRSSPQDNLPAPSGIAMIRADEVRKLKLPQEWGNWDDAIEL
jgi:hypothetical protein